MKIIMTLLLLAIMAGAVTVTNDAYAQTNTERLATIDETTSAISEVVDSIAASLGPLTEILSKLDNVLVSTASISQEVSEVKSSISGFGTTFLAIQAGVDSNRNTLTGITNQVLEMNTKIDNIQTTLGSAGDSGLEQRLDLLKTTIDNNNLAISQRLDTIETILTSLEGKLDTSSQPPPSTNLVRKTLTTDITSYDYKLGEKRSISGADVYFLNTKFSCDGPVSIDSVGTTVRTPHTPIIPTTSPNSATPENYLKVDNNDLYNSKFEVSAGTYSVLNRDYEFNLRPLLTGTTLDFTSRQVEDGTKISGSTRSAFSFQYQITVEYLGSDSTTCTLGSSNKNLNTALDQTGTILVNISATGSIVKTFSETISCNNDPVQITGIIGNVVDDWDASLIQFSEFKLSFPGDSTADTSIGFETDGSVSAITSPISFSNSNMVVSGKLPQATQMLVQIQYSTVTGGSCTVQ